MTTTESLCRHFSRMGARLKIQRPGARQGISVRIDVSRDRRGEFFDIRCQPGVLPEVLNVQPAARRLVLLVRDRGAKRKYLLGRGERRWFVAAVPDRDVHDVRTAIESLRPTEVKRVDAIRFGKWYLVPAVVLPAKIRAIHRKARLYTWFYTGLRPNVCQELAMFGGRSGVDYRQVGELEVYVRGYLRHPDHKTIRLDGWYRAYPDREHLAIRRSR